MGMNTLMIAFNLSDLSGIGWVTNVDHRCGLWANCVTDIGRGAINNDLTTTATIKIGYFTNSVSIRHIKILSKCAGNTLAVEIIMSLNSLSETVAMLVSCLAVLRRGAR
jgi:hypothetical protein